MSHRAHRLMGRWLGIIGVAVVAALLSACHPTTPPQEPITLISEMCCKAANKELTQFAGCREDHRSCEDDEPIWIRGAITCSEVREATCVGGRCCKYRPQYGSEDAVLNWELEASPEAKAADPAKVDSTAEAPSESSTASDTEDSVPATTPED